MSDSEIIALLVQQIAKKNALLKLMQEKIGWKPQSNQYEGVTKGVTR